MKPNALVSISLPRRFRLRPAALLGALLAFGVVRALTSSAIADDLDSDPAISAPAPLDTSGPAPQAAAPVRYAIPAVSTQPNSRAPSPTPPVTPSPLPTATMPLSQRAQAPLPFAAHSSAPTATSQPAASSTRVPAATAPPAAPIDGVSAPVDAGSQTAPRTVAPIIAPTPVPLFLNPSNVSLAPGQVLMVHTSGAYGEFHAISGNEQIARAEADQNDRTIRIDAFHLGATTITVTDQRGMTRILPVSVLPLAGQLAFITSTRITGTPASAVFVADAAQTAALAAAQRPSTVSAIIDPSAIRSALLKPDDTTDVQVPLTLTGPGYLPVSGMTIVHVENVAQPAVTPNSLIVSDFPERLTASGLLFTSNLNADAPTRLMFYHYNPKGQPNRHIVLRVKNTAGEAAQLQLIDGHGGPSSNEMMVGHLATERFLVRSQQNEGVLSNVPPASTVTLVDAALPAGTIVNDMMQIREITGQPLELILTAEDIAVAQPAAAIDDSGPLLTAPEHHARGVYPIPHFFYETTYEVGQDPLSIAVGELPLPNLRQGEALVGDYGVQLTIDAAISNPTARPAPIALYVNPRGGRATGTFIIDRTLVRAHALKSFTNYKLRQYVVPAHGIVNVQVVTMPEGGSSYPVNLIFAPDDGSVAPGAPGSPIY